MFVQYTFQDWLNAPETERTDLLMKIIKSYKASDEFRHAAVAEEYYTAGNTAITSKAVLRPFSATVTGEDGVARKTVFQKHIAGAQIHSDFFRRFVVQQVQYSVGNGILLDDGKASTSDVLGIGFDTLMAQMARKALVHGVCWAYWNADHVEMLPAYVDSLSGFFALVDEQTSQPMMGVQFWQIGADRPMYVRLFELEGVTTYRTNADDKSKLGEVSPRRAYRQLYASDAAGDTLIGEENYGTLPIIPLYGSDEQRSELTPAIKSKIDAYDVIVSDFADNLEQANEIYWVLNNFGGSESDIAETLATIHRLKAIANISDGMGSSTVEAKSFEVPHAARSAALELLQKALYRDYMAVSMDDLTGGSLTNVAIKTAFSSMDMKADLFENAVFSFVQQLLMLQGIETEQISFKRRMLYNESETIQSIYLMRQDIDQRTALLLNPMIPQDNVEDILAATQEEAVTPKDAADLIDAADEGLTDE